MLLPYYSALKVAEVFRMYEALFPGRIDLGIGRAPGGDHAHRAGAMNADAFAGEDRFPTQVQETGRLPRRRPAARVSVSHA